MGYAVLRSWKIVIIATYVWVFKLCLRALLIYLLPVVLLLHRGYVSERDSCMQ